jgi:hypothetical protein
MYELGDLSGKFGMLSGLKNLENDVTDTTLPLFGPYSVLGRGLVIHLALDGSRWVCTNVEPVGVKMTTAVAIFRYPLGGRFLFKLCDFHYFQLSDTIVFLYRSCIFASSVGGSTIRNHGLH